MPIAQPSCRAVRETSSFCLLAWSTTVNVVASWVVGQFEMANCIFAKQKIVNSEHLSVEPVSYKIQEPLGCIYI